MKNPAYTRKHWMLLICVAMMMGSSLGLLTNGNGVFYAPMARELNVPLGAISLHTTFKSFATAFAALTIPTFIERFGHKKLLAIGVALGTIGTFLMGYTYTLTMLYILGIIRGIGTAYYSMVPMSMILTRWFDKNQGLATGLASGTSGIIGSISAPILTLMIDAFDWRAGFVFKSVLVMLLGLPIILFPFQLNPEAEGLQPYGYEKKKAAQIIKRSQVKEILPTNFIFIALMAIGLLNTVVLFMNSHFPAYGESVGLIPGTASLMLSGAMIGNLVWKAVFGFLSDRIGTVKSALLMMSISFAGVFSMIFFQEPTALILGSFFFGGTFAISGVALPILSTSFFGPVNGAKVYSKVNFLSSFGGAIGVGVTGFIYDFTGSYVPAFIIALGLLVINGILLLLAQRTYLKELKPLEQKEFLN